MVGHLSKNPARPSLGWSVTLAALWCLLASPATAQGASLDALVRAYPDFLESHDGAVLIWKDGTHMPVGDSSSAKSFEEKLRHPSILDQLSIRYTRGRLEKPPEAWSARRILIVLMTRL
jgi:hypothetical protein